jgi:hypothetical protein
LDKYSKDGMMRFNAPVHPVLRVFFIAAGIFVVVIVLYELGRGVWPLNIASPFFLFMILGAFSVGVPITFGGLLGWESDWTIRRGEIFIDQRNPFRKRTIRLGQADVLRFDVIEVENSEGPNDWAVMLQPAKDRPIEMRRLRTLKGADEFRAEVERAFHGQGKH